MEPEVDDRLRALVKMAREDFDEEPSPRIDALLMAAARKHAPPPRVGVFERLRRWMAASMLNPAIAGATALVVIGGTAGVLYMKNQGKVASQPTVSRVEPAAPARAPEPQPADEFAVHLGEIETPATPVTPDVAETPTTIAKPDPRPRTRGTRGDERRTVDESPPPPPPPPPPPGGGEGVTIATGGVHSDMGGGADDAEDERKVEESLGAHRQAQTEATIASDSVTAAPSNRSQAENLHQQARNAARQRQCAPVRLMAQRAKKLDADYYARNIAIDPDIKPCL